MARPSFRTVNRLIIALLFAAAPLAAQSPPPHRPINPLAATRSPLAYQPIADFDPRGVRLQLTAEYANAIEYSVSSTATYLHDAELYRVTFSGTRELSPGFWTSGSVSLVGSHGGFTDAFFEWYHGVIGYEQPEREARPTNTYGFEVELPGGVHYAPDADGLALGEARLSLGMRHGLDQQSSISLVLPLAKGGGLGRSQPGVALNHTLRIRTLEPLVWEISGGVGATPRGGELEAWQHSLFGMGTTGVRLKLFGGHSIYGFFFYHTPFYHDTSIPSLDNDLLTADFGWNYRTAGGREWRIGFTEDIAPKDLGVDLTLIVSGEW